MTVYDDHNTDERAPLSPPVDGTFPPRVRTPTADRQQKKTSLAQRAASLLQPPKPVGRSPTVWRSIRAIIRSSWFNVFVVFIPISWALNFTLPDQHALVFVFAFLAIIPLTMLLDLATDELAIRVGHTLARLLDITSENIVALIFSIIALTKCELTIVQSSLVGTILNNLLLVVGMCFYAGGLRFSEQGFGQSVAQLNSSLLTVSVIAVLLPAAFRTALQGLPTSNETTINDDILKMSHGVAIVLLLTYGHYLVFQLFSHKHLYRDSSEDVLISRKYEGENPFDLKGKLRHRRDRKKTDQISDASITGSPMVASPRLLGNDESGEPSTILASVDHVSDLESTCVPHPMEFHDGRPEPEVEMPQLNVAVSLILLVAASVLVGVTADFLVGSINGLTASGNISPDFVGIILLPIISNAAKHVTVVTVSVKDKMTTCLAVAVGSSIQIALFVIPLVVTLAWILGKPLTLLFDPLQSVVMFLSVLTLSYIVQEGKSNWLKGTVLISLYLIAGITFWYYPGTPGIFTTC